MFWTGKWVCCNWKIFCIHVCCIRVVLYEIDGTKKSEENQFSCVPAWSVACQVIWMHACMPVLLNDWLDKLQGWLVLAQHYFVEGDIFSFLENSNWWEFSFVRSWVLFSDFDCFSVVSHFYWGFIFTMYFLQTCEF